MIKKLKLFRLTFYDNFSNKKKFYRATAEVVFNKKLDLNKLENEIINELKQINLISNLKKISVVKKYIIPFNVYNPKIQTFKKKNVCSYMVKITTTTNQWTLDGRCF